MKMGTEITKRCGEPEPVLWPYSHQESQISLNQHHTWYILQWVNLKSGRHSLFIIVGLRLSSSQVDGHTRLASLTEPDSHVKNGLGFGDKLLAYDSAPTQELQPELRVHGVLAGHHARLVCIALDQWHKTVQSFVLIVGLRRHRSCLAEVNKNINLGCSQDQGYSQFQCQGLLQGNPSLPNFKKGFSNSLTESKISPQWMHLHTHCR